MKKRFALILGGPHAGTGRLFSRLGQHPQVLPCRVREPRFFTDDRKWQLGLDWYRSLWDFMEPDERVAIEASGEYARHPAVSSPAARIAETPAGFRFVVVLREPVERVAAWHADRVAEGLAEPAQAAGDLASELAAARPATQLASYREHFPREDFLLVAHGEWLERPAAVLERICGFLEIDSTFGFPEPPVRRRVRRAPHGSWLSRLLGRGGRRDAPVGPVLAPELAEGLDRELRGERDRLAAEWAFDFESWREAEPA